MLLLAAWAGLNVPSAALGIGETLGTNLESTLGNGMFPSAAGFAACAWFLGDALRYGPARPARLAFSLALAVLLHPVWGLVAGLAGALFALSDLAGRGSKEPRGTLLVRWAYVGVLAFALAGFFVLPFLAHAGRLSSTAIPARWPILFWSTIIATAALTGLAWPRLPSAARRVALLAAALAGFVAAAPAAGISFHLYRLTVPTAVLVLPLLTLVLYKPWLELPTAVAAEGAVRRRVQWGLRLANLAVVLLLAGLFHLMGPVHPRGNPGLEAASLDGYDRREGRILALTEPYHSPGYMALPWAVVHGGGAVSHGISVESAVAARPIFGVVRRLAPNQFVWGVEMQGNPALLARDEDGTILARQLDLLGFSHLLSDRRNLAPLAPPAVGDTPALTFANYFSRAPDTLAVAARDFHLSDDGRAFHYRLHRLDGRGLATTALPFLGVPEARFVELRDHWFAMGGEAPVPVAGENLELPVRPGAGAAVREISDSGDRLVVTVSGPGGQAVPVYLKVPFHPNWRARSEAGEELPLLEAGFGMLLLAPPGPAAVEYADGPVEWAGRALTLLGLLLAATSVWRRQREAAA